MAPPYDEENCSGGHTAAELNRVKRVVSGSGLCLGVVRSKSLTSIFIIDSWWEKNKN